MVKKNRKNLGGLKGFAIQFLPYSEIRKLDSDERIRKILNVVLGNNIIILQGKLTPNEEARLIGDTMAMIGHVKNFRGIELAVVVGNGNEGFFSKFRRNFANAISGSDLGAVTVIGP